RKESGRARPVRAKDRGGAADFPAISARTDDRGRRDGAFADPETAAGGSGEATGQSPVAGPPDRRHRLLLGLQERRPFCARVQGPLGGVAARVPAPRCILTQFPRIHGAPLATAEAWTPREL